MTFTDSTKSLTDESSMALLTELMSRPGFLELIESILKKHPEVAFVEIIKADELNNYFEQREDIAG